ncbi:putative NADH dehydrogenase [Tieghemostelium lacteum]|uniref:Putative NADH dehydrogenase n=1 Tax=Tieghemostelium lacteum TaxID=361077 RepID=A0A151ZS75_TIELA|nr:putative NADH dehydrogenase [Tieghemostelium lacteum]|eukprot:KYQ96785.1 putative NADH dehydrogenase [Tieghemostelium lacteum]
MLKRVINNNSINIVRYYTSVSNLTIKNPNSKKVVKEKVVILGCGWSSYAFLMKLNTDKYDVTLVSPRNHFLFTPLLSSTCVGTLEFRSIAEPIRNSKDDFEYIQAQCLGIDPQKKTLECQGSLHGEKLFQISYDKLIVGIGARNNTFGIKGVEEHAYFLKELHQARSIRKRIIDIFEMASLPDCTEEERQRLLSIVIVGGGPTGVEVCSEISDAFLEDLSKWYPQAPINQVRITLLEASNRILNAFDEKLVKKAMINFKYSGVDIRTHTAVKEVQKDQVILQDGSVIKFGLLIWSTGIGPQKVLDNWKFMEKDKHGRIKVDKQLRVQGHQDIFAIGDCAGVDSENLPATAQVAQQEGHYLAHQFNLRAENTNHVPFEFHSSGLLAYIGKRSSLLQTKYFDLSGFIAFLSWRSAYLTRLGSLRAKIQVPFDWFRTLVFGRDITNF